MDFAHRDLSNQFGGVCCLNSKFLIGGDFT
jgi:hypothetical protein